MILVSIFVIWIRYFLHRGFAAGMLKVWIDFPLCISLMTKKLTFWYASWYLLLVLQYSTRWSRYNLYPCVSLILKWYVIKYIMCWNGLPRMFHLHNLTSSHSQSHCESCLEKCSSKQHFSFVLITLTVILRMEP